MQAGSLNILQSLCPLASRHVHVGFHTSAWVLKGGKRHKNKSFNRKGSPESPRTPARKRLVPSLKPEDNMGMYEVASRQRTGSRDRNAPGHGISISHAQRTPSSEAREPASSGDSSEGAEGRSATTRSKQLSVAKPDLKTFEREEAPHKGRIPDEGIGRERMLRPRRVDFGLRGFVARRRQFKSEYASRGLLAHGGDGDMSRSETPRVSKTSTPVVFPQEFHTPEFEPLKTLPSRFTSPPLMEGLLQSVHDVLGPRARPSPIQSLALKHLFAPPHIRSSEQHSSATYAAPSSLHAVWSQHLLAAETGSGKSIAYLLPMLQHLKLTEHHSTSMNLPPDRPLPLNPRGLILAPTHELARQLSAFAKGLLHNIRLKVLCTSRANTPSSTPARSTARQLKRELDQTGFGLSGVGSVGLRANRPVDVVVGTTTKVLEMVRGLGWDRAARVEEQWDEARKERARNWVPGSPEIGLANVQWVVVDEADVLFDRDFETSTRLLLADIARARGYTHPSFAELDTAFGEPVPPPTTPLSYPFHLTLASATIPISLAGYMSVAHPKMARLASPGLHRLPSTLTTEHCAWTSGNKNADIEKRIQHVWEEDVCSASKTRSKVLVFCNKSSKVEDLGLYLKEKGIPNIALTSEGAARARGSNRHLNGFLKNMEDTPRKPSPRSQEDTRPPSYEFTQMDSPTPSSSFGKSITTPSEPHVLITTSLLSRGLDFSPQIRHVFVTDPPRNMVDFLHRAGRAGRAGNAGRVVIFGRSKGRGAGEAREVRRQVQAVAG